MQVGPATSLAGAPQGTERVPPPGAGTSFAALLAERAGASPQGVVPAARTKLSTEEAREALTSAWQAHFGETPSAETTAILTAQWAHETGHGQSMWNFNFAGLKGKGPGGLSVSQRTKEGHGATERTITDQFRAYASKEEGAADYLGLLARRYPKALDAATQGDPETVVMELKNGGYFTGSEAAYVRSVKATTVSLLGRAPTLDPAARAPSLLPTEGTVSRQTLAESGRNEASVGRAPGPQSANLRPPLGEGESRSLLRVAEFGAATPSLDSFHDALSRAALRIALAPEHEEDRFL